MIRKYIKNNLIAIDQLLNTILAGDADETISSRVGKAMRKGNPWLVTRWLAGALDWLDPGHCEKSIEEDEGKDSVFKED